MKKIVLSGQPISTNSIYRSTDNRVYMTQKGKALKEQYQWEARSQWKGEPLAGEISLDVVFYHGDKRPRDIDNYSKILFDALEGIVFENDKQVKELHLIKEYDRESPRIEVYLV